MTNGPRFSIKWKIFLLIMFLISSALLVVLIRTSQIFKEDKEAFVKELSAKLTSSSAKNVTSLISTLQDKLIIFISSKESLSHTGAKIDDQVRVLFSRYQEFTSIGFIKEKEDGSLSPDWFLRNPDGAAAAWPVDYEKALIAKVDAKRAGKNGRVVWRLPAPDGTVLLMLGFSVDVSDPKATTPSKAWIVGILPPNIFSDLLTDFSTGLNTGFIVDDQGVAVGDSDPQARWKNLSNHPLVVEALKRDRPSGAGDFVGLDGRETIGSFENIPQMNLTAIVTTPRDKAFEAAETMSRNIIFIGVIILVLALATAILLSNYMIWPLQKLARLAGQIGSGDFNVSVDVKTNDEIGDLAESFSKMGKGLLERDEALAQAQSALVQSEKMGAFGQISAGIAHEVKNPLAGILGHAQLALSKIQNEDVKKHLDVIEKETRRCKQIVENLMKFARAEKADLAPTDLGQVIQDTINLVDHQLSLAGCKIYKDLKPCPIVPANSNQLQQVMLNLMVNASHAMETCETKNVTVRLVQVDKKAQIQIADTGTGIPPDIQKKIFEPFFTTKPAGKGTGLGLSVSIGIVKDHKGEIYLKSEMGKGTTFFIDIPIPDGAKMPTRPLENTHGGLTVEASAAVASAPPAQAPHTSPTPAAAVTPPLAVPLAAAKVGLKMPGPLTATTAPNIPKNLGTNPSVQKVPSAPVAAPFSAPAPVAAVPTPAAAAAPKAYHLASDDPSFPHDMSTKTEDSGLSKISTAWTPAAPNAAEPPPAAKAPEGEEMYFGTDTNTSMHMKKDIPTADTLGGKAPISAATGLPESPKEEEGITSFFTKSGLMPQTDPGVQPVPTKSTGDANTGTGTQNPAAVPVTKAASGEGTSTDFKVTIKRPKLKL